MPHLLPTLPISGPAVAQGGSGSPAGRDKKGKKQIIDSRGKKRAEQEHTARWDLTWRQAKLPPQKGTSVKTDRGRKERLRPKDVEVRSGEMLGTQRPSREPKGDLARFRARNRSRE